MDRPTDQVLQDLRTKLPGRTIVPLKHRIAVLDEELYFAVAVPTRAEWSKFQAQIADEDRRPFAVEDMVRQAVVYPSREEFAKLLDQWPGLSATLGNTVAKLAGASAAAEVGNW